VTHDSSASAQSGRRLKVLLAVMKYDYGVQEQGYGYEHYQFHDALVRMGCEVLYFDFMTLLKEHGRTAMNRLLRETVDREKPDILFCSLYKNEIDKDVMRAITEQTETVTLNWFCDDTFRFRGFSSRWARSFDWIFTVDKHCVPLYRRLGAAHAEYVRWACNPFLYTKNTNAPLYDVTFVGRSYGGRGAAIERLKKEGFSVRTWGRGWEGGRLSQSEMVEVFGRSRINLNFSDASVRPGWKGKIGLKFPKQIKGRLLEVPACGGFLLTGDAPLLPDYYTPGKDVAVFTSTDDLVEKVRYYLSYEEERAAIARSGYERTMQEHTYIHRFHAMFAAMGFSTPDPAAVLAGDVPAGTSTDVTLAVTDPVVSVIVPVYNGARFVGQTIESILAQQFRDFECIIVDDGSTDDTPAIIARYAAADARIRLHRLSPNAGKIAAFNAGFALARGRYIAITGADDISLPQRLWKGVNFLDAHPDIAAVGSWVDIIDGDGTVTGILRHPSSPALIAWLLHFRNPLAACATLIRRDTFEQLGWYHDEASEDYDFLARLSQSHAIANIPEVLAQYRVWDGNFTSRHKAAEEDTACSVIGRLSTSLLKEPVPAESVRALRLAMDGSEPVSLSQVRMAAALCLRLHRAFRRNRRLSVRDAQIVRHSVSEYLCLLARHAARQSRLLSVWLYANALIRNPLFVSHVLRHRFRR